jgi:hypothetical protein
MNSDMRGQKALMTGGTKGIGAAVSARPREAENHHVPLLLSRAPKPLIQKRRYVNRDEEFMKTGFPVDFDVMVEVAFADEDTFLAPTTLANVASTRLELPVGVSIYPRETNRPRGAGSIGGCRT